VIVPAPADNALSVRFCGPDTAAPKLIVLPFESTLTGPPTKASPPLNARPSKPLMVLPLAPPVVTSPLNTEPVSPLVSVTSLANVTGPAAVMPDLARTVSLNVDAPVPCRTKAAPVPLPRGVTVPMAPVNVFVPEPVLTVRFLLPSTVLANVTLELVVVTVELAPTITGLLNAIVPAAVLVTLPLSVMLLPAVAV
jgi:hypothetical protein